MHYWRRLLGPKSEAISKVSSERFRDICRVVWRVDVDEIFMS